MSGDPGVVPPRGDDPGPAGDRATEVVRAEEELDIRLREVPFGRARVTKSLVEREVRQAVELMADHYEVVEEPVVDAATDSGVTETLPDGSLSVPVLAERLVLRRETYVTKRLVLRRTRRPHAREDVREVLLAERVVAEIDRAPRPEDRERAAAVTGEDLSRGPTPLTRHPEGGRDDTQDTTQGPTPVIRKVMRTTGEDAAGEPGADPATRGDRTGTQDREDPAIGHDRYVVEPDPPVILVDGEDADP
jgi:hypothetical protein